MFYIHRYEQYAQAYYALYRIFSYTLHSALCIELVKASLPSTEELLSNSAREAERPPKAAATLAPPL